MICLADAEEICGGPNANSVYLAKSNSLNFIKLKAFFTHFELKESIIKHMSHTPRI